MIDHEIKKKESQGQGESICLVSIYLISLKKKKLENV